MILKIKIKRTDTVILLSATSGCSKKKKIKKKKKVTKKKKAKKAKTKKLKNIQFLQAAYQKFSLNGPVLLKYFCQDF